MSSVNVVAVNVLNNPGLFSDPVAFEIQYEAIEDLEEDLEWKITWVGSSESVEYDQVLDQVFVGPVTRGQYKFVFEADAPRAERIPVDNLLGATVVFVSGCYRDKEFLRIGYYVNVDYVDEALAEHPPEPPRIDRLSRNILADQPRVTRWTIDFRGSSQVDNSADEQGAPNLTNAIHEPSQGNKDGLSMLPDNSAQIFVSD